jgi:NAD(P)H-hydrate repair Nnr-like enzyme with NAD(P)H-hydrate dehydratase domain/NAD(P)H-hydrate repair Nnr-like enzyme with NAD(P)H-hydrate epimerase domain
VLRIATVDEIRAIEKEADAKGYSYSDMMDSAGRAAADRAREILKDIKAPRVTVLVGAGNNGGDGLVAGLYIAQDHPEALVNFYLLQKRDDTYAKTVQEAGLPISHAEDDKDKRVLRNMVASSDLVIDALFGIGVRLPIKEEAQKVLRHSKRAIEERRSETPEKLSINPTKSQQIPRSAPLYVLAIDCPSGMNCDTGEVDKETIAADETITFIAAKKGQFFYPAADYLGQLTVADIGISPKLEALQVVKDSVLDAETVRNLLPKRGSDSHKGTYGRALIVAGSVNYIGAPALSAEAAYRAGAGLVTVGAPNTVILALSGSLREVTWLLLPHDMGVIAEGAVTMLYKELNNMKSILVGPGLGTEKTTREFLLKLLEPNSEKAKTPTKRSLGFQTNLTLKEEEDEKITLPPLVIDADGLNLLAEVDNWWTLLPENTIITPHPGEMARLTGLDTKKVQEKRWDLAVEKAKEWNLIVMLKGAHTVIAAPNGDFVVLPFKTDALAKAGTGDVLAGLITGFLAQGMKAFDAAMVAGYLHGLAGQIAAESQSSRSILASDVLAAIGSAFKRLEA